MNYDVIILGAGAAGLMCARVAARRGKKVLVLEKNLTPGKKILISGGGRCNFTNLHVTAENYLSHNPHFSKSALSQFNPDDFITLVKQHKIAYYEKTLGQLFCQQSSKLILNLLIEECQSLGVELKTGLSTHQVERHDGFRVLTTDQTYHSQKLVVATGGLSFPKLGVSDLGYKIAELFGLNIIQPSPALVPLLWNKKDLKIYGSLSGISLPVEISFGKTSFKEAMLFTHHGLSGPAVLQISSYWKENGPLKIDLLPNQDAFVFLENQKQNRPKAELKTILATALPQRLAELISRHEFNNPLMQHLTKHQLQTLAKRLKNWEIIPATTAGFDQAEVTRGGIDTAELSSKTMETKKVPGLYFIGEVVDVTGWLGGYNFQWAWASGYAAGLAV